MCLIYNVLVYANDDNLKKIVFPKHILSHQI